MNVSLEQAARGFETMINVPGEGGSGERTLEVKIPAGIRDGQKVRVAGRGQPGSEGGRPATCWFRSTSSRTRASSARATISSRARQSAADGCAGRRDRRADSR